MSEASLTHEFQYSSARHQAETAISGMWLFLATEVLFFGALFLTWIYSRHWNQAGFDAGAQQTDLAIGTINTVILVVSSFVYSAGVAFIEAGNSRRLIQCCAAAGVLGVAFLILKFGIDWRDDFNEHLFPGARLRHQRSCWWRGAHLLRLLFLRHSAARSAHGRRAYPGLLDHSLCVAEGIFFPLLHAG